MLEVSLSGAATGELEEEDEGEMTSNCSEEEFTGKVKDAFVLS